MNRLLLRAQEASDGAPRLTWLLVEDRDVLLVDDGEGGVRRRMLPAGAVSAALRRYGRPLDIPRARLGDGEDALELPPPGSARLRAIRHRSPVDVIENDYFVLESEGAEPLAAPAPLVVAAILALARAATGP
jgi:hypothetical protein